MLTKGLRAHYLKKNMAVNKIINLLRYPLTKLRDKIVFGLSYYCLYVSYTGYCVRVRRSSDNAEMDFGFTNGYIDENAIVTWVGAGNSGYVSIWYNQYSLGNNATQVIIASQPRIVNGGVFEANGLYFQSTTITYMRVSDYAAVDFTTNNFSYIFKTGILDISARFLLTKNLDSSAQIQYGFLSNAGNISGRIEGATDRIFASFTVAMGLSFINFRTDGGLKLTVNNGTTSTASYIGSITSRPAIVVGARDNTGGTASGGWYGNIRSIIGFNTKLELDGFINRI